jgi:uncharacterized protein YciI
MLIISLTYVKSMDEANKYLEPHMAWVKEGFARGLFIASGRKVPRTGGIVFARGDRAEIEAFVATDIFWIEGIASYEITEMNVTSTINGLDLLKD